MHSVDTPSLGLAKFAKAREEAQNVAQWLARMAQSFGSGSIKPPSNELTWNRLARTFSTPEVAAGTVVELKIPELILHFTEGGKPSPHDMEVEGKSPAEVEAWLLVEMLHRGFDRERFSKVLPYNWLKLMTGDEIKYSPESVAYELELLTNHLEAATSVLLRAKALLVEEPNIDVSDAGAPHEAPDSLTCWPDRFEIGFTVNAAPAAGSSMKVGFTPGDCHNAEPRFFVRRSATDTLSPETEKGSITLKGILEGGMSDDEVSSQIVGRVLEQNVNGSA